MFTCYSALQRRRPRAEPHDKRRGGREATIPLAAPVKGFVPLFGTRRVGDPLSLCRASVPVAPGSPIGPGAVAASWRSRQSVGRIEMRSNPI
jgi:hypothetical protein